MISTHRRIFVSFLIFGLVNNVIYVVILSAAVDIVGYLLPKAIVLLADIMPSLSVKILAPFFVHRIPYGQRVWILVSLSSIGMILVSIAPYDHTLLKLVGVSMASLSSGLGEVSFLQLTHFYDEIKSIGGFSMGTGGAGVMGSLCYLIMTNIVGLDSRVALMAFAILPFGFPMIYYLVLPSPAFELEEDPSVIRSSCSISSLSIEGDYPTEAPTIGYWRPVWSNIANHVQETTLSIRPLIKPFMIPLCSVYAFEYLINQGISPTLLFPLDDLPRWLFGTYRDIYVVYGFVYQSGVFVSRSSLTFGFIFPRLYVLSGLQLLNVILALSQALNDYPFGSIYPVILLIFYEGLLGGLSYVNTFLGVSQNVKHDKRELSMACVGISDSFGIMIAGFLSLWLEKSLCAQQVSRGQDWCELGS